MLSDESFAIAESIGEHDRFAILTQNVRIGAGRRVHGLDEESELQRVLHGGSPRWPASPGGPQTSSPYRIADRGLVYELFQALVGAVLPDDDYDTSLLNSSASHAVHATTRVSNTQGNHKSGCTCPGHGSRFSLRC